MKKKLKKYQFAGENFCGEGTTWDDNLKQCVPNAPVKPSGIDPKLFPIITNRSESTNTGLHSATTDVNGKVVPGNIIPIQRDSSVAGGFIRPNAGSYDKRGNFIPYEKVVADALDKGFNLDSDGVYRKAEITTNPNNLEYSGGFKALNTALDLTRFIAGNINNYKVKADEQKRLEKARYQTPKYNSYENGLNNVPVYFEKGGSTKQPPAKNDKELASRILAQGSLMGRKLTTKQVKHFKAVVAGKIPMHGHTADAKAKGTYQQGGGLQMVDDTPEEIAAYAEYLKYHKVNENNIPLQWWTPLTPNPVIIPGPTTFQKQQGGYVNNTGYLEGYETANNPYNIIPSGNLTMDGVPHDVMAYPNNGNPKLMKANSGKYTFPEADYVTEVPQYKNGGKPCYECGGEHVMMQIGGDVSIVDYLKEHHQDSDYATRKAMAKELGIDNYRGTAKQNLKMLRTLQEADTEEAPVVSPSEARAATTNVNANVGVPAVEEAPVAAQASGISANEAIAATTSVNANTGVPVVEEAAATKVVPTTKTKESVAKAVAPNKSTKKLISKVKPITVKTDSYQGFENDKQLYFAKQAALANDGRFVLTDKATNRTFYGTYNSKTDKFDVNGFEVLTGSNKNSDIDPHITATQMNELEKQGKNINPYKVTPVGFYPLKKGEYYGYTGYGIGESGTAYHKTYVGNDDGQRPYLYNNNNKQDNYRTWGCVNCQKPSIDNLTKFIGNTPINALILNSGKSFKENANTIRTNTPDNKLNLPFQQGGNVQEVEGGSQYANAELEQGEVFQTQQGQIQKVAESEPTHEDGGSPQPNVHRVLEDTADKRGDKDSKLLKVSKDDAKQLLDITIKSPTSHSKLYELALEKYDAKRKTLENTISKNLDYVKAGGGKYAQASLEENLRVLQNIPTKGQLFDAIYSHQENVKNKYGIDQEANPEMKKGGMPKYQNGSSQAVTDEIIKKARTLPKGAKVSSNASFVGETDKGKYYKLPSGETTFVPTSGPGKYAPQDPNTYIPTLANQSWDALVANKKVLNTPQYKAIYDKAREAQYPDANYIMDPKFATNIKISSDTGVLDTGTTTTGTTSNTNTNTKYNFKNGVTPSKFNEPLRWYDVAGNALNYLSSLDADPVPLEQLKRDPLQVHEVNPLPALQQNQSDFNAALSILPTNGVGFANQANLQGTKYKANNEVLGQYENVNKGKKDQIDQYNDQAKYQVDVANMGLRDTSNQRVATRNEIQRQSKLNALDDLFTKVAQNRALSRNGDLVLQLTPYFDQFAKFNGNNYDITQYKKDINDGRYSVKTISVNGKDQEVVLDNKTGKYISKSHVLDKEK